MTSRPSQAGPGHRLTVDDLGVCLAAESHPVLDGVHLSLVPGSTVGVVGRSGSGKSTLLQTLSGLVPWLHPARVRGEITLDSEPLGDLDPGQRAHLLATCLDRPDAQLFLPTPAHELAAAASLYGSSPLAERAVELLEVGPLLDRRTTELSSGERQRVTLAVVLAACPRPILLDEPTAHLDQRAAAALARLLEESSQASGTVLLTEQAGWRLGDLGRWHRLGNGRLGPCPAPVTPVIPKPGHKPLDRVVLEAEGIAIRRGKRDLLRQVDLVIKAGEVVMLTGANGAGKSTLASTLAGLRRPARGRVQRGRSRVALMLPVAELQLFAATVLGELTALAGKSHGLAKVLRRHRLEHLAARAPWTLSRGERQRLVHATLDLLRPDLMIVDEPGQGLDTEDLIQLVGLIHRRAEKGRAYLVISHREELRAAAHRHLRIRDGRIEEADQ